MSKAVGTDVSSEYLEYMDFLRTVDETKRVGFSHRLKVRLGVTLGTLVLLAIGTAICYKQTMPIVADFERWVSVFYGIVILGIILTLVAYELRVHWKWHDTRYQVDLPDGLTTIKKVTTTKEYDVLGIDVANSGDELNGHLVTSYPMDRVYLLLENSQGEVTPVKFNIFMTKLGYHYEDTYLKDVTLVKSPRPQMITITTSMPENKYIARYLRGHGYGDYSITITGEDKVGGVPDDQEDE